MSSLSEKPESGKKELSVEELKALRLCRCGDYKYPTHSKCGKCFLLFEADGPHEEFCSELKRVKQGEIHYSELFRFLDSDIASRKIVMIQIILNQKIRVSEEDFLLLRHNIERRSAKKFGFRTNPERCKIAKQLSQGVETYSGFNTVT